MRLASWNVNGLRAAAGKGYFAWLEDHDPDVVLLQETKAHAEMLPKELRDVPGWFTRYHAAQRRGYSGVGIWTRFEPDEWIVGVGEEEFDREGRALSARFADLVVTSAYFPNSQDGGARLDYKLGFDAAIARFLAAQRASGRRVVVGGDFNVAHQDVDIARPQENVGSPGFLPEERAWFSEFLSSGYVDTWRAQHPDVKDVYSWWSMKTRARERNVGWRIDYFVVDASLWPDVRATGIQTEITGSDHCPVTLEIRSPK
jgi:exodeoxyribonuclease-3